MLKTLPVPIPDPTDPNRKLLLTKKEICSRLGFSKTTAEKLMKVEHMPHLKLGTSRQARVFFRLEEVEKWLKRTFGSRAFHKEKLT